MTALVSTASGIELSTLHSIQAYPHLGAIPESTLQNTLHSAPVNDPEAAGSASAINLPDPLNLRARLVEAKLLEDAAKGLSFGSRKRKQYKHLQQFYETQNEHIGNLLKPMQEIAIQADAAEDAARLKVKIAVWGSFVANLFLAGLQLYAAASSVRNRSVPYTTSYPDLL